MVQIFVQHSGLQLPGIPLLNYRTDFRNTKIVMSFKTTEGILCKLRRKIALPTFSLREASDCFATANSPAAYPNYYLQNVFPMQNSPDLTV